MDLEQIRREYHGRPLNREDLKAEPIEQFQLWLQQAVEASIPDPTAMVVATVAPDGRPSQRIVLLKHLDERGLVFYTNLESRKAKDIEANNHISLHFPWHVMNRQVKMSGVATRLGTAEVLKYFLSRPRDSQIAAAISPQSRSVESRQFLMQQFSSLKEKLKNREIPLPDFWGGFRIEPYEFEFWQGRENRLHDRFFYQKKGRDWGVERLAP